MRLEERRASEGLDLALHRKKWAKAKEYALRSMPNYDNKYLTYWMRVHLMFFELGGEYKPGWRLGVKVE